VACQSAFAVENYTNNTFNETAPTSGNISNWDTGWQQPTVQPNGYTYTTGWNYVGTINGASSGPASGTYLGNGWVITCAHVGANSFVLNGTTYPVVPNSAQAFTATTVVSTGTSTTNTLTLPVDITLFQVSPAPALPDLPIRSTDPVAGSSAFAMIGYGDGASMSNETWGYDTVTSPYINQGTQLLNWASYDFYTANGNKAKYEVVGGDSGGGDFMYNATLNRWELAGLNEAELTNGTNGPEIGSAFIQLDTYLDQINGIITPAPTDSPTMPQWALILLGAMLCLAAGSRVAPGRG
jgi:hypothetical protein